MSGDNTNGQHGDQGATPPADQPANPPAPQDGPPAAGETDTAKLQRALDRERSLRKDAEKRARENEAAKARADELEQASQSDTEKAVTAARREAETETMTRAHGMLRLAEARAVAAELRFQDPRDATVLIDLSDVRVAEDGTVDTAAITERLTQLAKDKPYLVAAEKPAEPTPPRAPRPDPSQGSGRTAPPTGAEKGVDEARRRFGDRAQVGATSN